MQFIETNTRTSHDTYFSLHYPKKELLFFDIETTGFSAANTKLYFIGCMYYKNDAWQVGMWFNDDGNSEQDMLHAFIAFSKHYSILIHFNGDGFDIPYLDQKRSQYGISEGLSHMESIDIYKWMKPYKKVLGLPNLKLKTIEKYLHINREDTYSGGELISVYDKYLRTRDDSLFDLLFTHNYEDIRNMLDSSGILFYKDLFDGKHLEPTYRVHGDTIKISFAASLPQKLSVTKHQTLLTADGNQVILTLPIMTGELKYFFNNYKDYFYLPIEDTAIHKSVAVYMDKNYRKKATKENCYQKITGSFLPTYNYAATKSFGSSYAERTSFMETDQLETAEFDLHAYTKAILQWFLF